MNAKELLEYLENGAELTSGWKRRFGYSIKPKYQFKLKLISGEVIIVQRSNVEALLKTNKIHSIQTIHGMKYVLGRHEFGFNDSRVTIS